MQYDLGLPGTPDRSSGVCFWFQGNFWENGFAAVSDRSRIGDAKHWQSIRTTNPIESTFATTRHRIRLSKGSLSRSTLLSMMSKLGQCAESRWRRLRGYRTPRSSREWNSRTEIKIQSDSTTVAA